MQQLQFEPAWDRTLAVKDREWIKNVFEETKDIKADGLKVVVLWTAANHKGEHLVTVLLHNFSEKEEVFSNRKAAYKENGETVGENTFTVPVELSPWTSMPWTFIFPAACLKGEPSGKQVQLEIENI